MSYSIIYDMKIVEDQKKLWLVLLSGDNNVYTVKWDGRQVRSREWNPIGPFENKSELLEYTTRFIEEWDKGAIQSLKWKTYQKFFNKLQRMIPEPNRFTIGTNERPEQPIFVHMYYLYKNPEDKYKDIRENVETYLDTQPFRLFTKEETEGIKLKILEMFPTIKEEDLFKTTKTLSPELNKMQR